MRDKPEQSNAERLADERQREHEEMLDVGMGRGTEWFSLTPYAGIIAAPGKDYIVVQEQGSPERSVVFADQIERLRDLLTAVLDGTLAERVPFPRQDEDPF